MIVKELDSFPATADTWAKAGRAAEEQMAFYLRRAFRDDPSVHVINGLRLAQDGDAAQIDHLALYRYGVTVIESKSVAGRIRINAQGEWSRCYGRYTTGMASPVLQAERQAAFLRTYLENHRSLLLDDKNGTFQAVACDILVAVSDQGLVQRAKGIEVDAVCKADQVPSRLEDDITALTFAERSAKSIFDLFSRSAKMHVLSNAELSRVSEFLVSHHMPHRPKSDAHTERHTSGAARQSQRPHAMSYHCRHCKSDSLAIAFGYSYYFRCLCCAGSTPISVSCSTCGGKQQVRKNGNHFFLDCSRCRMSTQFFTNPQAVG